MTPNFLPPRSLTTPLWKRLFSNLRDAIAPPKQPPLQVTSQPVNLGMILGDRLAMPWYRTVFTNLGDVITPETQPPLELQSAPVDVELIGDQTSKPWWTSLVRNLADAIAPERQPALAITSAPVNPPRASDYLTAPRWSDLLDTPKVFYPDAPKDPAERYRGFVFAPPPPPVRTPATESAYQVRVRQIMTEKKKNLRYARLREGLWVSCVLAEVVFLVLWWWRF